MGFEAKREHTVTREDEGDQMPSWRGVFLYFLMLGFIKIGGPVAQITMMYNHMVERRHWLSEDRFVKIMAFSHRCPVFITAAIIGIAGTLVFAATVEERTQRKKQTVTVCRNRKDQTDYGRLAQRHSLLYSWTPQTTRFHITRGAGIGVRHRG